MIDQDFVSPQAPRLIPTTGDDLTIRIALQAMETALDALRKGNPIEAMDALSQGLGMIKNL